MEKDVTQRIAKKLPDLLLFDGHDCVSALKALGEDNRVRIIGLLMDAPLGVCEIARRLGSTYYNVSKRLRILREAGLLEVELPFMPFGSPMTYVAKGKQYIVLSLGDLRLAALALP